MESKNRMKAMRKRKAEQGLLRKELWVHPDNLERFENFKEDLEASNYFAIQRLREGEK